MCTFPNMFSPIKQKKTDIHVNVTEVPIVQNNFKKFIRTKQ
jgi:hypothetical protein